MSGFSRKLIQDIHQMLNEGNVPLSLEMRKKIKERAFELADKMTNVIKIKSKEFLQECRRR